jgi:hypothetical protein
LSVRACLKLGRGIADAPVARRNLTVQGRGFDRFSFSRGSGPLLGTAPRDKQAKVVQAGVQRMNSDTSGLSVLNLLLELFSGSNHACLPLLLTVRSAALLRPCARPAVCIVDFGAEMVDCGDGREHGCPVELCITRFTRSARNLRAPRGDRDYTWLTLRDHIGPARHEVGDPLHEVDGSATRTRSITLGVALADLHGARYPICIVHRWSVAGMASCLNTGKKIQ